MSNITEGLVARGGLHISEAFERFSVDTMVDGYKRVYSTIFAREGDREAKGRQ